jgi:CDP-glucose 4,6-dehydratase
VGVSVPFEGAFRGVRVLVTGHTGFKGSWLALWLHRLGAEVTGYSLPPATEPSLFRAAGVRDGLAVHHEADVRDRRALRAAFDAAAPVVVFHLAAQPIVRRGYAEPYETIETNVLGTAAVLDTVRELGLRCVVVVVSSDKCYLNRESGRPCRESDRLGGDDPYSASKAAAELVVEAYRRSYFAPAEAPRHGVWVASARSGNVIGGGDWSPDRIVPDCARALAAGRPVTVRNPCALRPWQHVLEPLCGYLTLAARLLAGDAPHLASEWNFGPRPEDEASVRDLVSALHKAWGAGSWVELPQSGAPREAVVLRLAIDGALRALGWRPRWSLDEAIRRTAHWYRRQAEIGDRTGAMADACLAEIRDYESA